MPSPHDRKNAPPAYLVDAHTRIGHVHLKVADLDRSLRFYSGVLGFQVTQRLGNGAAFLAAGRYHHHIGLNTWESLGGAPPAVGTTGLYHTAILYPTRAALAEAFRRILKAGLPVNGAADHGVSESIYLRDPDGNGVELYRDKPQEEWPHNSDGELAMYTHPLDLRELLKEAPPELDLGSGPRDL
jgi:catechol 2,3-dioxygenase